MYFRVARVLYTLKLNGSIYLSFVAVVQKVRFTVMWLFVVVFCVRLVGVINGPSFFFFNRRGYTSRRRNPEVMRVRTELSRIKLEACVAENVAHLQGCVHFVYK